MRRQNQEDYDHARSYDPSHRVPFRNDDGRRRRASTFAASQAHADTAATPRRHELFDRLRRAEVRHGAGPRHLDRHRLPRPRGRAGPRASSRSTPSRTADRSTRSTCRRAPSSRPAGRRQEDHAQGRERLADRRHRQGPSHAHAVARAQGQRVRSHRAVRVRRDQAAQQDPRRQVRLRLEGHAAVRALGLHQGRHEAQRARTSTTRSSSPSASRRSRDPAILDPNNWAGRFGVRATTKPTFSYKTTKVMLSGANTPITAGAGEAVDGRASTATSWTSWRRSKAR